MGAVLVLTKRSVEVGREIGARQLTKLILRTPHQGLASLDAGFFYAQQLLCTQQDCVACNQTLVPQVPLTKAGLSL